MSHDDALSRMEAFSKQLDKNLEAVKKLGTDLMKMQETTFIKTVERIQKFNSTKWDSKMKACHAPR